MTGERVVRLFVLFGTEHFLRLWTFFTGPDPTGGRVKYLSRAEAQEKGLAYVQGDRAVLRVDSRTNLPLGALRDSCVVPLKLAEVPTSLTPSFSIIAFVSFPRRHSTMVSLLLTLPACRSVVLYGLHFG